MELHQQIKQRLSQQNSIEMIRRMLNDGFFQSLLAFVEYICGCFGFLDEQGTSQKDICLVVLQEMEQEGLFADSEPVVSKSRKWKSPQRLEEAVPAPQNVPATGGPRYVV